jgi:hypothetical protein
MRRRTWGKFCAGLGLIALAFLSIDCGSSSGGAKLRLVNGTPDESSLDLLVDTKSFVSGVGYGAASAYTSISSGSRQLQIEPTGTTSVLIDTTANVGSGDNLSLITLNYSSNISSIVLTDDNSAPTSGDFKLRIVNASPGMGAQDVYVVTFGTNINSVDPTFSSLGFGSVAAYSTLAAGDYEVFFTPPGQKVPINLDSGEVSFSAGQIRTMLALNNPVGAFMTTVLSDAN